MCILWEIWCTRNRAYFNLVVPLFDDCLANIGHHLTMLMWIRENADIDSFGGQGQLSPFVSGLLEGNAQVLKVVVDGA